MNKQQMVEQLSAGTGLTKADTERVLNTAIDIIKKSVRKAEDVTLVGFGTFSKSKRKARKGRNPQTGQEIKIPSMTVPKFKAGKAFREYLN